MNLKFMGIDLTFIRIDVEYAKATVCVQHFAVSKLQPEVCFGAELPIAKISVIGVSKMYFLGFKYDV